MQGQGKPVFCSKNMTRMPQSQVERRDELLFRDGGAVRSLATMRGGCHELDEREFSSGEPVLFTPQVYLVTTQHGLSWEEEPLNIS